MKKKQIIQVILVWVIPAMVIVSFVMWIGFITICVRIAQAWGWL